MTKINYSNISFFGAYGSTIELPKSIKDEIAFVGKSNVGKSSLLNKICSSNKLAKVSANPGKTTTINFFDAGCCYLVDLPGYGYSKRSQADRKRWAKLIEHYFESNRKHKLVVCLFDIRHNPTQLDLSMLNYLRMLNLNYVSVFTKSDKISKQKTLHAANSNSRILKIDQNTDMFITSSATGKGIDKLKSYIESTL